MKIIRYIWPHLVAFSIFLVFAFVSEQYLLSDKNGTESIDRFRKAFLHKQQQASDIIDEVEQVLLSDKTSDRSKIFESLSYLDEYHHDNNISIMVSERGQLLFWTDNVGCFPSEVLMPRAKPGLVNLPNGWYYHMRSVVGTQQTDALILVKKNFRIKNNYLRNGFAEGFYFPRKFEVLQQAKNGSFPIFDIDGKYAFSVKPTGTVNSKHKLLLIPSFLYLLAFITFLLTLYKVNAHFLHNRQIFKFFLQFIFLLAIYALMNYFRIPSSVYLTTLFSPRDFAYTSFLSSLGELLIFSMLILFLTIVFNRSFYIQENIAMRIFSSRIWMIIGIFITALYFVFVRFMMFSIVVNSSMSLALYRLEELTFESLLGYLSIALLILSFLFFASKVIKQFRKNIKGSVYFFVTTVVFSAVAILSYVVDKQGYFRLSVFFLLFALISFYANRKGVLSHKLLLAVVYVLLFSLFVGITMPKFVRIDEKEIQKTMAMNLSSEHDPKAELLLTEIDKKIIADMPLIQNFGNYVSVGEYLERRYFGGYFREYDLQVTLCDENDSLIVQPEGTMSHCNEFFDEMIENDGSAIQNTNFYSMANATGRITYLGRYFHTNGNGVVINLFIELNSRLRSEGIGFPELLLPLNSPENHQKRDFSYAKYYDGILVDRGGKFPYPMESQGYTSDSGNVFFAQWNGYEHCVYNYSDKGFILVSRKLTSFADYLIFFPYIFVFFFIIALILIVFSFPTYNIIRKERSLRSKIQNSIIGIVFAALFVVGSGTIFYIISNYKKNYQNGLIEKINSLSVEVETATEKAGFSEGFNSDNIGYELARISNIFQTDVNLFDLTGHLVSTSRPEIYEKGLISTLMNNKAFYQMAGNRSPIFLQQEFIGSMQYLSAYLPILNGKGETTGYLNVPYFTREKAFRQEITTFILAFVNIYVFLLLISILAAYFISTGITGPLKLIRDHLQSVQFGKNPIPIKYRSDDELGVLIAEYNRKVEELAESAELIARSERESAWREMARQIAHEIKNPLTPIKLNIQFLQRTNPSSVENYQEILDRVSHTIIEQIDNLSNIATEFSNFAKIPKAKNERFNLIDRLEEIISLFDYAGECSIDRKFKGAEGIEIFADKEQFSRAVINLVRNAIQSIPENRVGKITVSAKPEKGAVIVSVADNGKGISPEMEENIFVPNFTTKTSGTGLGLAITKGIVENFRGEIWFSSELNTGTTFYIRIPMVK